MAEEAPPARPAADDRYPGEGCVVLWIKFQIVGAVVGMLAMPWLVALPVFREVMPEFREWMLVPHYLLGSLAVVSLIALKARYMWGYLGLWAVGVASAALDLFAGMSFTAVVTGFSGLVILYWVLQIGGDRSGWSRLK